jgi:hypothetical protein
LTSRGLQDVNIFELFDSKTTLEFASEVLPLNGIYIPKDFEKKV